MIVQLIITGVFLEGGCFFSILHFTVWSIQYQYNTNTFLLAKNRAFSFLLSKNEINHRTAETLKSFLIFFKSMYIHVFFFTFNNYLLFHLFPPPRLFLFGEVSRKTQKNKILIIVLLIIMMNIPHHICIQPEQCFINANSILRYFGLIKSIERVTLLLLLCEERRERKRKRVSEQRSRKIFFFHKKQTKFILSSLRV